MCAVVQVSVGIVMAMYGQTDLEADVKLQKPPKKMSKCKYVSAEASVVSHYSDRNL